MNVIEIIKKDNNSYLKLNEKNLLNEKLHYYYAVWRDVVIKNSSQQVSSNKNVMVLKDVFYEIEKEQVFQRSTKVGELDKPLVDIMLKISILLNNSEIVDKIYKRTKSSIVVCPNYFYMNKLIDSYIMLNNEKKAIEILNQCFKVENKAYMYRILEMDLENYVESIEFYKELDSIKIHCFLKLLESGEKMEIDNDMFKKIIKSLM